MSKWKKRPKDCSATEWRELRNQAIVDDRLRHEKMSAAALGHKYGGLSASQVNRILRANLRAAVQRVLHR